MIYRDGRPVSEASINDMPIQTTAPSGDLKKLSLRIAQITAVNANTNTVDVSWVWPFPGTMSNITLSRPYVGLASGIHFIPEKGSLVVMGFAFNIPVILSYLLPSDYENLLSGQLDTQGNPSRIQQINPGEILLNSIQNGQIYIHDQIQLLDDNGDQLLIDPATGTISIDSLNFDVLNDAGEIFMGITNRNKNGTPTIITNNGQTIIDGGVALNELTINVQQYASSTIGNSNTPNPTLATVNIGTLVDGNGLQVLNELGNTIVCSVSFNSGAQLTIDSSGKFNFNEGRMTNPSQIIPPNTNALTTQNIPSFPLTQSKQRAAREGDTISVPVVLSTDLDHPNLADVAISNITQMTALASSFTVMGIPCVFVPGAPINFQGEIVTGSDDVYIGAMDEKLTIPTIPGL